MYTSSSFKVSECWQQATVVLAILDQIYANMNIIKDKKKV